MYGWQRPVAVMRNSVGSGSLFLSSLEDSLEWSIPPNGYTIETVVDGSDVPQRKLRFRKMYLAAGAALLSAISTGMSLAYSSPATADMKHADSGVQVTEDDISWIGSVLSLGSIIGGILGGYLTDKIGRKDTLIFNFVPFTMGWLFIIQASSPANIFLGRALTGVSCGIVVVAAPMYLVEISTPEIRGCLGTSFHVFVVLGMLVVVLFGCVLRWRWLAVSCLAEIVVALIFLCPMPESPRWLVSKGCGVDALQALVYFQGDFMVAEEECDNIANDIRKQQKGKFTFRDLKQPTNRKPAMLSLALMFFQQASGVAPVIFFTVQIFENSESKLDPLMAAAIVNAVQVVLTVLSSFIIDRTGRRALLMVSGLGMALSMTAMGVYDFKSSSLSDYRWIPLVCLVVFITTYSIGFGCIPYMMTSELAPVRARSYIGSISITFASVIAFTATKYFNALQTSPIQAYGTYWLFASFSYVSVIFVFFLLPETKGKRLEDIPSLFTETGGYKPLK